MLVDGVCKNPGRNRDVRVCREVRKAHFKPNPG